MKRYIAVLLIAVMIFSGCGAVTEPEVTEFQPVTTQPATTQRSQGSNKLTVGIAKSYLVTGYEMNAYTRYLEQQTGLELEFSYFASGSGNHAVQLEAMIKAGIELPDIIMDVPIEKQAYEQYGKDGVFVDLMPYFEDRTGSSVWWDRFEQLPEETRKVALEMITCDGAIYGFPTVEVSQGTTMDYQVYINKEWLNALNLSVPTDPESLYTVLKAFKEGDPNGNGEADEVPLIGTTEPGGDVFSWIINMFLYYDDQALTHLNAEGQHYDPATTDTYRDALRFIRKLYAEELLSPLSFSMRNSDMVGFVEADKTGIICGNVLEMVKLGSEKLANYEAVPLWGYGVRNPATCHVSTFITKDCENVDAAWSLLMAMSTEESALRQRYGKPGETWDQTEGGLRLYGDNWTIPGDDNWRIIEATVFTDVRQELVPGLDDVFMRYGLQEAMFESYEARPQQQNRTFYLLGDSELVALRRTYLSRFTTGRLDIENDDHWQAYIKSLQL